MTKLAVWLIRRLTGAWICHTMPPAICRVVNAARLLTHAWDSRNKQLSYYATFELMDAVDDLELSYGHLLDDRMPPR